MGLHIGLCHGPRSWAGRPRPHTSTGEQAADLLNAPKDQQGLQGLRLEGLPGLLKLSRPARRTQYSRRGGRGRQVCLRRVDSGGEDEIWVGGILMDAVAKQRGETLSLSLSITLFGAWDGREVNA